MPPVRPRDAATVILARPDARGHVTVLMGRRQRKAKFAPDMFVFPGGKVDPDDELAEIVGHLSDHEANRLVTGGAATPRMARRLATAAVRETWEETGYLIGATQPDGERVKADHSPLSFLGRAITPTESPIRFHARFFVADGTQMTENPVGSGELTDLAWIPIDEAMRLPAIDVTHFMLEQLKARTGEWSPMPLFVYRNNRPAIRWTNHP